MKNFPVLLFATLGLLCALPAAQAETPPCNCNCQCVATPSGTAAPAAINVPAPTVTEAVNGELNLQSLGAADATVEVAYPDISDGHYVGLYWTSPIGQFRAPVQKVSGGAKSVTFKIPNITVVNDLGQTARLTASVRIGSNPLVISALLEIKVVSSAPVVQFPQPTLPGLPSNQIDIGALAGDLGVSVNYPSQNQGDIVQVFWNGATTYKTPLKIAPDNNPLAFTIPQATVVANLGKPVTLTYETSLNGQPARTSNPAPVNVRLLTVRDIPIVPDAVGGQLDLATIRGKPVKVTFTYPGVNIGHTAGIRWAGTPPYDTPHPPIGATPRPLEFTIPYDKVLGEKNKTVAITASISTGSGSLVISPPLSLDIIDSRSGSDGYQVANDLNARYNGTRVACDNNTPSYYCNGVTLRGTTDGNFDPWDPSATAVRKGSISFSHMRTGSNFIAPARNSGFILLSQDDAIAQGTQQEHLCSYPHNANTDLVGRPANGCGLQTRANQPLIDLLASKPELANLLMENEEVLERLRNNQDPDGLLKNNPKLAGLLQETPTLGPLLSENQRMVEQWAKTPRLADLSTCASVNAATLPTWITYTRKLTNGAQQCSLSTQNAAQFDTSLKARLTSMPAIHTSWNEVLIKVWRSGIPTQLPLQAFYYSNASGLPAAKIYQQKYAARTNGLWIPVIKIDITKLNAAPFSYNSADQAVQP